MNYEHDVDWRSLEREDRQQQQGNVVPMKADRPARIDSRKVRVFGKTAALTFEETTSRHEGQTISVDAAAKQGETVLWKDKIIFQFTVDELPVLAAVLIGALPEFDFKFHGEKKDKSVGVYRRANAVLFKVVHGQKCFTVPVPPGQLFHLSSLVMSQLSASWPGIDGSMMLAQIRSLASVVQVAPQGDAGGRQQNNHGPRG